MAIYHLHAQIISRSEGRSSVAAAAYRAGEKMHNKLDGITHDYTRKNGVVHSEIITPENAPLEFQDRAILWNAVEQAEKRKDSQTARELDIALPIEFDLVEQIEIIREYVQGNFVDCGMVADIAIHDTGKGNPHAHVMLTTRHVTLDGFDGKNRDWNKKALLESWRENWADICNERFKQKGLDERIDHRTLDAQRIDREPTIHEGRLPERKRENAEIKARNELVKTERTAEYIHDLMEGYVILDRAIERVKSEGTQGDINALVAEKDEIRQEYQRQKLLAEIRADWAKIRERLKELAQEFRARVQNVREDLARRKSERVLDTVTERNFRGILGKVLPWQERALMEHRAKGKELVKGVELEI